MRLVIDTLLALMLTALLGGLIWHYHHEREQSEAWLVVHRSLAQLHEQVLFQKSLGEAEGNDVGFPLLLDADWFDRPLPRNALASAPHPWLDVAPEGDMAGHPPDPVLTHPAQAGLWYNPNRGIFRARVPEQLSEASTLRMYNELNSTSLAKLPRHVDASRRAQAHPAPGARVSAEVDDWLIATPVVQTVVHRPAAPTPDAEPEPQRRRPTLLTRSPRE